MRCPHLPHECVDPGCREHGRNAVKSSCAPPPDHAMMQACRPNARLLLAERIKELEDELVCLQALSGSLPVALNPQADEGLYRLLSRSRR